MVFTPHPHHHLPHLILFPLLLACIARAEAPDAPLPAQLPADTIAAWAGTEQIPFSHNGRTGILLVPHTAAKDRPWLWSAGPPASDGVNRNLLERGFHIAWINVNDLYGNTEALSHWEAFYDWAVKEQQLSGKPALAGSGEDALAMFGWAARHPECAGCLYAQDPWLDLQPVPDASSPAYEKVLRAHGIASGAEAAPFPGAPLNAAAQFGKAAVPMLFLYLGQEPSSPPLKQSEQFYKAYRLSGQGSFETVAAADNPLLENGLTLHALYFILKNTGHLPGAKPGEPLPETSEWAVADFSGSAKIQVLGDTLIIETGNDMSGVLWQGDVPKMDYEITLEAMRLSGNDFFCGLTAPWEDSAFSLIIGGWGGTCIGISSLDYLDAYNNETACFRSLMSHRWYPIKLRVTGGRIQAWVDKRWEMASVTPLGIATWRTTGAFRNFRLTPLPPQETAGE